jgi:hypothetical protein
MATLADTAITLIRHINNDFWKPTVVLNIRHITRGFVLATLFRGCRLLNAVEQLEH